MNIVQLSPGDLDRLEGAYSPSVKRRIISSSATIVGVLALIYGCFALGWAGVEKIDVLLIFVVAVSSLAIGVLTYGGKVVVEKESLKVEFLFGLKKYMFLKKDIELITVVENENKFTPITVYSDTKVYPMPGNNDFLKRVVMLQQVAGGDAAR